MPSVQSPEEITADTPRDRGRLGAILVEQGRLNPSDIEEIQRFAAANGYDSAMPPRSWDC